MITQNALRWLTGEETKKRSCFSLLSASSSSDRDAHVYTRYCGVCKSEGKKKSPNAAVAKSPAAYEVIWDGALNTSRKKRKLIESGLLTSRGDIELVIDKEQEIHFCLEFTTAGPKHNNE